MYPWAKTAFKKHLKKGYCLRPESARAILHAERFSTAIKRDLNTLLTIRFNAKPRCRKSNYYDIFRLRIWATIYDRYKTMAVAKGSSQRLAAIAVFENPPNKWIGKRHYGPIHVHMMLEWPKNRHKQLEIYARRAMHKYFYGGKKDDVHVQDIPYSPGFASYMAKGIDPPYADHFYVTHKPQGPIKHRRIVVSRALGPAARKAFKAAGGNPLPNRRKHRIWRMSQMI